METCVIVFMIISLASSWDVLIFVSVGRHYGVYFLSTEKSACEEHIRQRAQDDIKGSGELTYARSAGS